MPWQVYSDDNNQGTPIHPNNQTKGLERPDEKSSNYIGPQVQKEKNGQIIWAVNLGGISRFLRIIATTQKFSITIGWFVIFPMEWSFNDKI